MQEQKFLSYIRADIRSLSQVDCEEEGMAMVNRIKGQLNMLVYTKAISDDSHKKIAEEFQTARDQAEKNIKAAR